MRNDLPIDLEAALDRQKQAWLSGSRPDIDAMLEDTDGGSCSESLLDLIYNEVLLREEIGEHPSLDEYLDRYPHLNDDLRAQFEVHQAVREGLDATRHSDDGASEDEPRLLFRDELAFPAGYEILGELGRGGMGVVYKARDRRLRRIVALKMFHPGRRPTDREMSRFRSEAQVIARLQHANIVQIFEVGEASGSPYLALEYAEGGTLQHRLQEMPFAPHAAADLIRRLAHGVQHAHEHHVVHRDLKPANVLFAADGTAKITDFGLAKLLEADADAAHDATRSGEPIGTPRYMSPEQAAGHADRVGPRTDVYALGTLLYECLTGRPPFVSPSVVETVDKIRNDAPIPPRRLQPSTPRALETICLHCLEKDPLRRYPTALALADDLTRFLEGKSIVAKAPPAWERAWKWSRRNPSIVSAHAMACTFLIAAWIFFALRHRAEQDRIANLRIEISALIQEGQRALSVGDGRIAKDRFQEALAKVQNEPIMSDHLLGVRGWLDHSHRLAERQLGKLRRSPPLFDERRDEAILLAFSSDPARPESMRTAHEAIAGALEFALADDPAWHADREALIVLDAELSRREGKTAEALARLKSDPAAASGAVGLRLQASLLEALGDAKQARRCRDKAETQPRAWILESLLRGMEQARTKNYEAAIGSFDDVLAVDPEHFVGRCLQSMCFLRCDRMGEAKVALTACIAQRPRTGRCYALRGEAQSAAGNLLAAAGDLQRAHELGYADGETCLHTFAAALRKRPEADRAALLAQDIETEEGRRKIGDTPFFASLERLAKK